METTGSVAEVDDIDLMRPRNVPPMPILVFRRPERLQGTVISNNDFDVEATSFSIRVPRRDSMFISMGCILCNGESAFVQ